MLTERSLYWYSQGTVPAGGTVYTMDADTLPQPLYTTPGFRWLPMTFSEATWTPPKKLYVNWIQLAWEVGVPYDTWLSWNEEQRQGEIQVWVDVGSVNYMSGTPQGSESGDYSRDISIFHDWPKDWRYSQYIVLPHPVLVNRAPHGRYNMGDRLNFEFLFGSFPLLWAVIQIGLVVDESEVWTDY